MSDPYRGPQQTLPGGQGSPDAWHDTTVIPRVPTGAGYPPAQGVAPYGPADPQAAHWERRYRRQRTFLQVLAAVVLVGVLAVVGLGFAAWQALRDNPLVNAAQDLSSSLGGSTGEGSPLDGLLPADPAPDAPAQDGAPDAPALPEGGEGGVPLPEELRDLGDALGITDVRQLLDLAVANGLMTQEQADAVAAAIALGSALGSPSEEQ
jgi:hypothetical protein